jgi:hypothetical protein
MQHRPEAADMTRRTRLAVVAIVVGVSALVAAGRAPALAGTFSDMAGNWSGAGTLTRKDGSNERLRCLARYDVGGAGEQVTLSLKCASDTFKFDLSGYIRNSGGAISGQWSEPNYNSSGSLDGSAGDGKINAHAVGNTFSAYLLVTTHGSRQSVTIQPQEQDVTRVSLSFQKR